jgi:hypothetical protein
MFLIAASVLVAGCSSEPPPRPPLSPAERAAEAARAVTRPTIPEDIADGSFDSPLPASDAEQILLRTGVFDMAAPGFRLGRQVEAFNVVLNQDDARLRLRRLARQGRAPGRLYALCGLLLLERPEGVGLAHSLSLQPGNVTVRDGDFTFETTTVRAIVLVFADALPERIRKARRGGSEYFIPRAWQPRRR